MKRISKNIRIVKELLILTKFLTRAYFTGSEKESDAFRLMLLGTCKKSYYFLQSIESLSVSYKNGDAIIDLSRSMFENLICITFAKEFKPQKKAIKFFKYTPVELWDDTDYVQRVGVKIQQSILDKRRSEYDSVKGEFLRSDPKEDAKKIIDRILDISEQLGISISPTNRKLILDEYLKKKFGENKVEPELNRSWAGVSLEEMMIELEKKGKFPGTLKITLEKVYTIGNRKNHLSPVDIETMLDNPKRHAFHQRENGKIGIYTAALSHIMLVLELAKELKNDVLKNKMEKIEKQLLSR